AHPARELVRVVALESGEADALDPIARALVRVATGHTAEPRTRGHVVEHALPREDRVDLKDVSNVAPYPAHDLVSNAYLALARWLETGDERERRRFSAAGRADDRAELALLHGEVEIAQRRVRRTGRREEALRHVPKLDRRGHPEERGSVLRRRRERRRYPLLASESRADRPARLDRSIPGPPGSILGRYRGGHARVVGAGQGADLRRAGAGHRHRFGRLSPGPGERDGPGVDARDRRKRRFGSRPRDRGLTAPRATPQAPDLRSSAKRHRRPARA